jgi:predicted O-methyltransferase YrrM
MQFSDPEAQAVFDQYHERHQRELDLTRELPRDAFGERRDEFLLPVGAAVGDFLRSLTVGKKAGTILELGTSYGYSTLFLADAARQSGGKVISIDSEKHKQDYAADMLGKAGLADHVEFRCGDALKIVEDLAGPFDLVLLDIWKNLYLPCFEAVYPKLAEEGIIVSDNMIYPESAREAVRAYRKAAQAKGDLQNVLLPLGSGIELSIRWSEDSPSL